MFRPRHACLLKSLLAGAWLGAALLGPAEFLAQQKKDRPTRSKPQAKPVEAPVPFYEGEKLEYRVQWSKSLDAATVWLIVNGRGPFYGREVWHFQAQAHTIDPMRFLYALDDQFDSYSESAGLASLQYEMHLREQGKQEDAVFRLSAEGDPAPGGVSTVRVLPGTRDPIGFIYSIRAVDWARTKEIRAPVFDGKKLYEVWARLEVDRREISVPAGKYGASRIEIRVYERGRELAETRFWVWLSDDTRRTLVLLEAELPFGSARVELIRAE